MSLWRYRAVHGPCIDEERATKPLYINQEVTNMLQWTMIFLVLAVIAAFFGFGSLAGTAASIAQILFFVFLAAVVISFFTRRRGPLT